MTTLRNLPTRTAFLAWADQIGPDAAQFVGSIMAARTHPRQAYKSCLDVLRRGKTYGDTVSNSPAAGRCI